MPCASLRLRGLLVESKSLSLLNKRQAEAAMAIAVVRLKWYEEAIAVRGLNY